MAKGFESFFDQLKDPWSSSLYGYTVKTIFIHLDDSNKDVKDAIYKVLQKASRIQTKDFIFQCEEAERKYGSPILCQNLAAYARKTHL